MRAKDLPTKDPRTKDPRTKDRPTADRVDRIQGEWRRERPEIDVSPQGVIGRLHRVANALTDEIVAVYQAHGLGEGEFDVLCALRRAGPPYARRPAELARTTMITTGAATKRIDRLEAAGLVRRTADTDGDARAKSVALTAKGRALIDKAFTAHMRNEARLVALVPERDRAHLERILKRWLRDLGED